MKRQPLLHLLGRICRPAQLGWICTPVLLLLLLTACGGGRHEAMLAQLEELEEQNQNNAVMTNDSLAERLAQYFDRHGTSRERVRAHYILGLTYADLGEAPAALASYQDAADCANTTSDDCDWAKLSRVYGQMGEQYYKQELLEYNLLSLDKSIEYAWKGKDTIQALTGQMHKVNTLFRLLRPEAALSLFDSTYQVIEHHVGPGYASKFCILPVEELLSQRLLDKAKSLLERYESYSGYFDSLGNVEAGRETYYYFRGHYHLLRCQYDSAEHYFRKEMHDGLDFYNQNAGAMGLAQLYEKERQPDSSSHYALLSYAMLDSLYRQTTTWEVAQAKAMHDYTRHQREAQHEREQAARERRKAVALWWTVALALALLVAVLLQWQRSRRRKEKLYQQKQEELARAHDELDSLRMQEEELDKILQREKELSLWKDERIEHREEELSTLHAVEKHLLERIDALERLTTTLQQELSRLRNVARTADSDEYQYEQTSAYLLLQEHCKDASMPTNGEWEEVWKDIEMQLPGLHQFLSTHQRVIGQNGCRICILLRFHFRVKDVANLLGVSSAYVSEKCSDVLFALYHTSGGGKLLTQKLSTLR